MDSFTDVSAYCKALKNIADQLANVNSPVSEKRLVLQIVKRLNTKYHTVASIIQQTVPLPTFYKARSMLTMEESLQSGATTDQSETSLAAAARHYAAPVQPVQRQQVQPEPEPAVRGTANYVPRGRGRGDRSRGRGGRSRGRGFSPTPWYSPWQYAPPWQTPPAPYPTTPMTRGHGGNQSFAGILGQAPQPYQGFYAPTNLHQAFAGLQLNSDNNWYMDTGATSHMTHNPGLPDADSFPPM